MIKYVFLGDTLLNNEPLGIQRYAYELLREIDNTEFGKKCELLIPSRCECNICFKHIHIVKYGYGIGMAWRQVFFPCYVKKNNAIGIDLTLGLPVLGCHVLCIHDCINENYPADFVTWKEKIKRYSYMIRAKMCIRRSLKLFTVSNYSKEEICSQYKIPHNKVTVIYNAWQHMNRVKADYTILDRLNISSKSFCFSLGSKLPHKNFKWIINVAKNNPKYLFVVTGTKRLSSYSKEYDLRKIDNIIFTGYLSDSEIKALMSKCILFIHSSLYEGFGIPPLEALACGARIAISDATCLPEIYKSSAVYFNGLQSDNVSIDELLVATNGIETDILDRYSWEASANVMINELSKIGG